LDAARRAYLDPPDAAPDVLKKRMLTNLYNERPAWLAMLHADLNRAVWAAYEWEDADPAAVAEDVILGRLLALNSDRVGPRARFGPTPGFKATADPATVAPETTGPGRACRRRR
jgi:hypothetical protein